MSLRLAFMGTPDFAVPTLAALIARGHDIVCVYSQPPRPKGRGYGTEPSPVAKLAEERGIDVRTPVSLRTPQAQEDFRALDLDAAVVVAYGLILPKAVLDVPRHGCFNLHGSLLPRWRGAAPLQRAIMAGDAETGVMVMRMDEGLDTGPVALTERTPVGRKTYGALHDELAATGARLMGDAMSLLARGELRLSAQPEDGATYAKKIEKAEARIAWTKSAAELDCLIRGLSPVPGAWCEVRGERLKILLAEPVEGTGAPGAVLDGRLTIATGGGALRLLKVQRAGRGAMEPIEFLRGFPLAPGDRLA
jgi:methionyl-tRNA formyltransferase